MKYFSVKFHKDIKDNNSKAFGMLLPYKNLTSYWYIIILKV
jgi:hypothetical protein